MDKINKIPKKQLAGNNNLKKNKKSHKRSKSLMVPKNTQNQKLFNLKHMNSQRKRKITDDIKHKLSKFSYIGLNIKA